jgi:hypothetical protein
MVFGARTGLITYPNGEKERVNIRIAGNGVSGEPLIMKGVPVRNYILQGAIRIRDCRLMQGYSGRLQRSQGLPLRTKRITPRPHPFGKA